MIVGCQGIADVGLDHACAKQIGVVPRAALQDVVAGTAFDSVAAVLAEYDVIATGGVYSVGHATGEDNISTATTSNVVSVGSGFDVVVATLIGIDDVEAVAGVNVVVVDGVVNLVGPAGHGIGGAREVAVGVESVRPVGKIRIHAPRKHSGVAVANVDDAAVAGVAVGKRAGFYAPEIDAQFACRVVLRILLIRKYYGTTK